MDIALIVVSGMLLLLLFIILTNNLNKNHQEALKGINGVSARSYQDFNILTSELTKINVKIESFQDLKDKLANPKTRGTFGETILEDCIKQMGWKENVHYLVQQKNEEGDIPDITLLLPNGIKCNIDSKFPYDNYKKGDYIKFDKDVKDRIKEVSSKSYIDPLKGTTSFAICFIPNDTLFNFILDRSPDLYDYCAKLNVVLASPWVLFSILYSMSHFHMLFALTDDKWELIKNRAEFVKQWEKYKEAFNILEERFEKSSDALQSLKVTRTKAFDRILNKL